MRYKYLANLRETQQASKLNIYFPKVNVNDISLVFDEKVARHFWRIAIVTALLRSRDSEIRGAIVIVAKSNIILKCLINKLFPNENTYQGKNQTVKARGQKLKQEAAVNGELRENMNVHCENIWGRKSI